jgi:hypothetical protein
MILDEFERCGVSAAEFAAQIGVKYSTFAHWRQIRSRKQTGGRDLVCPASAALLPAGPNSATRWVEAVVEANGSSGMARGASLKIALPGGASLEVSQAAQMQLAADLLRALEGRGPC